jgi:hypothetical protein
MSNFTSMIPLAPGHARHSVYPVYLDQGGFYGCVTEVWMTDETGHVTARFAAEDFTKAELLQLAGTMPDGCHHGLVSWQYSEDTLAMEFYAILADLQDQEQVRAPDIAPAYLRADLDAALDQILGR